MMQLVERIILQAVHQTYRESITDRTQQTGRVKKPETFAGFESSEEENTEDLVEQLLSTSPCELSPEAAPSRLRPQKKSRPEEIRAPPDFSQSEVAPLRSPLNGQQKKQIRSMLMIDTEGINSEFTHGGETGVILKGGSPEPDELVDLARELSAQIV